MPSFLLHSNGRWGFSIKIRGGGGLRKFIYFIRASSSIPVDVTKVGHRKKSGGGGGGGGEEGGCPEFK